MSYQVLTLLLLLPIAAAIGSLVPMRRTALAVGNIIAALGTIIVSTYVILLPASPKSSLNTFSGHAGWLGLENPLMIDSISRPLPLFAAILWLLAIGVMPHRLLDRASLFRIALGTTATMGCFLAANYLLLSLFWILSTVAYLASLLSPQHKRGFRIGVIYLGASAILLPLGILLLVNTEHWSSLPAGLGLVTVLASVFLRKAIFPLHTWAPEMFENGRLGHAILFGAPQVGAYVTARIILPQATESILNLMVALSAFTAIYAALLTIFQADARRALGYLFMSQTSLVLLGLASAAPEGITGALCLWLSSGVAFAGLGRAVLVLEARRGRLSLNTLNGGYASMPLLASMFLCMGLATVAFPGTLGFVGEKLLVEGAISISAPLGLVVILGNALLGIAVLRMYFSLFCGPSKLAVELKLKRREMILFAFLAAGLLIGGLFPQPLLHSRAQAAEQLIKMNSEKRFLHTL